MNVTDCPADWRTDNAPVSYAKRGPFEWMNPQSLQADPQKLVRFYSCLLCECNLLIHNVHWK